MIEKGTSDFGQVFFEALHGMNTNAGCVRKVAPNVLASLGTDPESNRIRNMAMNALEIKALQNEKQWHKRNAQVSAPSLSVGSEVLLKNRQVHKKNTYEG